MNTNILFLDVDGVLNNFYTKTWSRQGFKGLDDRLVKLLKDWVESRRSRFPLDIVLSSTWRTDPVMKKELNESGIKWIGETPQLPHGHRGREIEAWLLNNHSIAHLSYAILDDTTEMLSHQLKNFVQTSYIHGLRSKNLRKLDEIFVRQGGFFPS